MMNERTHLISHQDKHNDEEANYPPYPPDLEEDDDEYYFSSSPSMSKRTRHSLYIMGALLTLCTLYLFTMFLPNAFIPTATTLTTIDKISDLNVVLIPQDVELEGKRHAHRIILIGDSHGHYKELTKLLSKVKYNNKKDRVVMLGDFISKGPDSLKVIDFLIENNIDCVMGNHEYHILQDYASYHGLLQPVFAEDIDNIGFSNTNHQDFSVAKTLHPHHVKYINGCSVIKKLGTTPLIAGKKSSTLSAPGVAVHAGIRWDLALEHQIPVENLEMRALIGPGYTETSADSNVPNAVSWSKVHNMKQKLGEAKEEWIVYYGHDSSRGLNIKEYTKGLDSRCHKGGRLSAMVIWLEKEDSEIVYKEKLVQVNC